MNKNLIKKFHSSKTKIALAIAGGGAEVIGELLRYGGGSNTVLEAQVPYNQTAFEEYIGGKCDKFVSEDAACHLAVAAYHRAKKLYSGTDPVKGVGVTASLTKENEREGRMHHAYISIHAEDETSTCHIAYNAYSRTREVEEAVLAGFILQELGVKTSIDNIPHASDTVEKIVNQIYRIPTAKQIYNQTEKAICISGTSNSGKRIIFPGSFNPIHAGHLEMLKIASEVCPTEWVNNRSPEFEISYTNVDKPALSHKALVERINRIKEVGCVWLTNAPYFAQKAILFPECVFMVGFDTMMRIANSKYYKNNYEREEAYSIFQNQQIKWLVFPRHKDDGEISTGKDLQCLPNAICKSMYVIPSFANNLSSTQLRNAMSQT